MRLAFLVLHICAGAVGLLSGSVAMIFRKGSRGHRLAGNVFVVSMLSLAVSATYLALLKSQITNVLGGVLTFYLVATAWATARHEDGRTGLFDFGALLFALIVGASQVIFGLQAVYSQTGLRYGYPAGIYFFMGSVVLLASAGDIRMLARGGVFGRQRIARHLWRMCFGLFIASASFFIGRPQVFPAFVRRTNVLFVLGILPLILMIFWIVRIRFANAYQGQENPRGAKVVHKDSALKLPAPIQNL